MTQPKPGEVWGVPEKPGTNRQVLEVNKWIVYTSPTFYLNSASFDSWGRWVRRSGASLVVAEKGKE